MSGYDSYRARLSYEEVQQHTKWNSSVMINDYLGIGQESSNISDRIASNTSAISANSDDIMANGNAIADVSDRVSVIETWSEVIDVASSYATEKSCTLAINNSSPISVTLNGSPEDGEVVHFIYGGAADATIIGPINGGADLIVFIAPSGGTLVYSDALSGWFLR